jgi:hypothetical protein
VSQAVAAELDRMANEYAQQADDLEAQLGIARDLPLPGVV